jgi:hypothetical protein
MAATTITSYLDNPMIRPNDTRLYWSADSNEHPVKLLWSEMTRQQKRWVIEAEERAAYDAMFDPNGFLY